MAGKLPGHDLMAASLWRRVAPRGVPLPTDEPDAERIVAIEKAQRDRRTLQALSRPDWGKLTDSGGSLAQIGPVLAKLPPDQAAVGSSFARSTVRASGAMAFGPRGVSAHGRDVSGTSLGRRCVPLA